MSLNFGALKMELSSILGSAGVMGAITGWATGAVPWQAAAPVIVGGVVSVLLPEVTPAQAQTLVSDALTMEQAIQAAIQKSSPSTQAVTKGP